MSDLRYLTLPNGNQIPSVGLGTYAPRNTDKEISEAIRNAVKVGYRHFDCAALYMNEKVIGEALNKAMNDGLVKREELFITSKLWDTFHRPDLVRTALKTTLQDLKLEYLDLYLIHWPVSFLEDAGPFPKDDDGVMICSDVDYVDTWKSLEECVKEGLVRNIGISNFNSKQVQRVLDMCSIKPCTNQVEVNVHFANSKLIEFCHRNGITVTSYCPLGSPDNKQ
ncbi:hypothetical protein FSP39_023980 [Pinctada imbricata]|uniref:NADP-dependent oxidoreductase domain-containing protein n=1 Tax=Pinctada imbricata TaxID=66713 RepID=A0AA88YEU5_PINIB|nr:hypothetical protein FSP39_023980 [Pinctada imbricata]